MFLIHEKQLWFWVINNIYDKVIYNKILLLKFVNVFIRYKEK